MPGSTPAFAIEYPCGGEQIDPAVFQSYAESTQDALDSVSALQSQLLRPPAALIRQRLGTQSIAAGVTTVATYTEVTYDTAAMFSLGAPTVLTITQPGTYLASFQLTRFLPPTTQTSLRAALLLNGVEVAFNKSDESTGAFANDSPQWVSAILPQLVAGNTISSNALFTGTGNMSIFALLSAIRTSIS